MSSERIEELKRQKVLKLAAPCDMPEPVATCVGCGICARACPCKAILTM